MNPRYLVSLAEDGAFLVYDRRAIHKRTARYQPREFVCGQGGYNPRTDAYPDYVHSQLWALHESAQRAQLERSRTARACTGCSAPIPTNYARCKTCILSA
jgi:hypothetical protein